MISSCSLTHQSSVKIKAEAAKLATTPDDIVCDVMLDQYKRLPEVEASYMPIPITAPHDAVGVANVIVPALLIWCGLVPEPLIADQPLEVVMLARAYDPPDTSTTP